MEENEKEKNKCLRMRWITMNLDSPIEFAGNAAHTDTGPL